MISRPCNPDLSSLHTLVSTLLAPKGLPVPQRPPRLAKRWFIAAAVRAPSRGEADGVGELRVCGKIQLFDQSEGDCLIIPLAQQIQKRLRVLDIALSRVRVKKASEELNRVAHVFGRNAER